MFRTAWKSAKHLALLVCLFSGIVTEGAAEQSRISAICDAAAEVAARESGVPLDVLRAISLTETGRKSKHGFAPWPWTVNMEGIGKWFDDVGVAQAYVDRHFARGARSFDVGCFQVNYKWHGQAFASIEEMFDPILNARYAASFLAELHDEFGDWSQAAGAYHSRTPKHAKRYTARFKRIRANLPDHSPTLRRAAVSQVTAQPPSVPARTNSYPFFIAAHEGRGASLVPLQSAGTAFLARGRARPLVEVR